MEDCLFCQIVLKKVPAKFVYQSDNLVAFPDINPSAQVHILIVPKEHVTTFHALEAKHGAMLTEIFQVASKLVEENNLEDNVYRVVVNGGRAQHIPHLHFHLLGGKWWKRE